MMLLTIEFDNLHVLLRNLYTEMMPLCTDMTGVAKGIAGLGALFYVAMRVWQSLARAEPIDVYPMLRTFVIGFCVILKRLIWCRRKNTTSNWKTSAGHREMCGP